jgi:hypothetical protein
MYKGSFFPASSPTFDVGVGVFISSYSNKSVIFIWISFMAKNGEHFFFCFLAIQISSFQKVFSLFQLPTSFLGH